MPAPPNAFEVTAGHRLTQAEPDPCAASRGTTPALCVSRACPRDRSLPTPISQPIRRSTGRRARLTFASPLQILPRSRPTHLVHPGPSLRRDASGVTSAETFTRTLAGMSRRRNASRRSSPPRVRKPTPEPAPQPNASPAGSPRAGSAPQVDSAVQARRLAASTCEWCGGPIAVKATGRPPKWCSPSCRQRAWEQSRAAASGRSAVQVVERRVEVQIPLAPGRQDGRGCSAASPVNSTTAGSTTATCSPSRSCSTPFTRRSIAASAPAGADSSRRHGLTDRGDIPGHGWVTGPDANVTPAARPSHATADEASLAKTSKSSGSGCHQTAEIGAFSHGRSAPAVGVRTTTRSEEKR